MNLDCSKERRSILSTWILMVVMAKIISMIITIILIMLLMMLMGLLVLVLASPQRLIPLFAFLYRADIPTLGIATPLPMGLPY